jgi:hypothetical protein
VLAADRDLLAAIPVNALPGRPALTAADTTPGLCDGVITTAERLRHLAWQSAQQPPWAPALTVTSLRQAAETSALTSHHCALLADSLAARAAQGAFPAASPDLAAGAQAARHAAGAWFQAARALRQITTDTRGQVTPGRRRSPRPRLVDGAAGPRRPRLDARQRPQLPATRTADPGPRAGGSPASRYRHPPGGRRPGPARGHRTPPAPGRRPGRADPGAHPHPHRRL